ncbi:MAG: hypothetical protein QXJ44_04860 [Candidatus Nitrosocaldus sp.]
MSGMDSVKTNRTRRQRGYSFEHELVRRINSCNGWKAIRLGSPSVAMPDVVAVNNAKGIMLAIEAKSTSTDTIKVPIEQVARCINWLNLFTRYRHRHAILALKFMSKRWKKAYTYEHRALQEYYYRWEWDEEAHHDDVVSKVMRILLEESKKSSKSYIACKYDGSLCIYINDAGTDAATILTNTNSSNYEGRRIRLDLNAFTMPWESKNNDSG